MTGLSVWAVISAPLRSTEGRLGCSAGLHMTVSQGDACLLSPPSYRAPPASQAEKEGTCHDSSFCFWFLLSSRNGSRLQLDPPT